MGSKAELRVFIASPGGLDEERDAVEQIASSLNATLSDRLNVSLAVRRFEQLPARSGRPQDQINSWVDDCDVLIAVVHRRWGSSSGIGDHTGFSEEFFRAIERFEQTKHPTVSLHFKRVEEDSEADPGPQLERVMAFRRRIETEHIGLYKRFESLDGFKINIQQLLVEEMLTMASAQGSTTVDSAPISGPRSEMTVREDEPPTSDESGIAQVLEDFANVLRHGETARSLDFDRIQLFATSIARDPDIPSAHLANRMFQRRESEQLSIFEYGGLFEAYIADQGRSNAVHDRAIPFALLAGRDKIKTELIERASQLVNSAISNVPRGTLRLLSAFEVRPDEFWAYGKSHRAEVLARWIKLVDDGLSTDAAIYWATVSQYSDIALASDLADSQTESVAKLGRFLCALLDTTLAGDAIVALEPNLLLDRRVLARLGGVPLKRASTDTVTELAESKFLTDEVRREAIKEIAARDAWTQGMIEMLFEEDRVGRFLGDSWKTWARNLLFRSEDPRVLSLLVDEAAKRGNKATLALAQWAAVNPSFRPIFLSLERDYLAEPDVSSHFALFANEPSYLAEANQIVAGTFAPTNAMVARLRAGDSDDSVVDFVKEEHIAAALTYLVRSQSTVPRGTLNRLREQVAVSKLFRFDLLAVLEDIAEDRDVQYLLETFTYLWRESPSRLGRLLARASLTRLRTLLDHESPEFTLAALAELGRRDRLPTFKKLKSLMRHSDAAVRIASLHAAVPQIPEPAAFISTYVQEGESYYYNVVCELDRMASGSPPIY